MNVTPEDRSTRWSKNELPEVVYLGVERGCGPIFAYTIEENAVAWLQAPSRSSRRMWQVARTDARECTLTTPKPRLTVVEEEESKRENELPLRPSVEMRAEARVSPDGRNVALRQRNGERWRCTDGRARTDADVAFWSPLRAQS